MNEKTFVILLLVSLAGSIDVDLSGYILYCPCMGRFGNQADQFLGALGFAKALNRTLVLPPWVEYHSGVSRSVQIPFDTYFKVEPLQEYHRVITMELFMKELAPTVWPPEERISFCYAARQDGPTPNDCNAKDGNPFKSFWDTFQIDFVKSEFTQLLYNSADPFEMNRWNERYKPEKFPVLAFTGAPGPFPILQHSVKNHRYLKWSENIDNKAEAFIQENLERPFLGIHLRNGIDFKRACEHVEQTPGMFAAAQCIGYGGKVKGKMTHEVCYPSDKTVTSQVRKEVKRIKAKSLFIATDDRDLIQPLTKTLKNVKVIRQPQPSSPHVDLAILAKADHYIGNCVSTFSAFAKRERDAARLSSSFWAFDPKPKHKKEHEEL